MQLTRRRQRFQTSNDEPLLAARSVSAGYGGVPVVREIDIAVGRGEVVALLGANGAGKSTTVRVLAGQIKPISGEVWFRGQPTRAPLHQRARAGLRLITEERSVFTDLSTADNMRVGRPTREQCLEMFPRLEPLLQRKAGLLSGGEQQMLTLARALAGNPVVLLADELSLGLAPLVFERLLVAIREAANRGTGVLLVEQHVRDALAVADRAYVLSAGQVVMQGAASELTGQLEEIERSYLATGATLEG